MESAKNIYQRMKIESSIPVVLSIIADLELLKRRVSKRLAERRDKLPQLEAFKAGLVVINSTSKSQTEVERSGAEIAAVVKAMELVESGKEVENFESEVTPLQRDYEEIFPEATVLSFEGRQPTDYEIARKIIMEFVAVAEKYYPLDVQYEFSNGARVCNCGRLLSEVDEVCPKCQFPVEREPSVQSAEHKDTDHEAKENFKREFFRYQGLMHNTIPTSLYDSLDDHFVRNRVPTGLMIRKNFKLVEGGDGMRKRVGKNDNGTVIRTSVSMMVDALRKTGNSGYYCDLNYICQEYWGWELPRLADLEEPILNHDYDAVQLEYNKLMRAIDGKCDPRFSYFAKRKSNLSCRFRLYCHLRARGHECSEEDFKLVTLYNLRMEYRKLLREVFAKAGLPLPEE